jgi:transcriptional regulator with GAF, ATPase, and Fis domain
MGKKIRGIEPGAMKMLTGYHWPGNIRELENTLERAKWVQKDAARLLGVSSRALNYKIKSFAISHPNGKQNR